MRLVAGILFLVVPAGFAQAQNPIVITSQDMFFKEGLYYRYHANDPANEVSVTGRLGSTGGPQSWNFVLGPTDVIHRFDYIKAEESEWADDFPGARLAEQKTNESTEALSWLFLDQVEGIGRRVYGFYDEAFAEDKPSTPFDSPIVDFPDPIRYEDTWVVNTSFRTTVLEVPAIINYTASATVDAYGIINLPGLGFDDCLRVNELTEWEIRVDLFADGVFHTVGRQFVRNYYWLVQDNGIVAQITSRQEQAPPPDNFSVAAQFVRMFENNHPGADRNPGAVRDLSVTLDRDRALLSWSRTLNTVRYEVQYTSTPADAISWEVLGATSSDFMIDGTVSGNRHRFYRVVSLPE